jgi:hypothetical protein
MHVDLGKEAIKYLISGYLLGMESQFVCGGCLSRREILITWQLALIIIGFCTWLD